MRPEALDSLCAESSLDLSKDLQQTSPDNWLPTPFQDTSESITTSQRLICRGLPLHWLEHDAHQCTYIHPGPGVQLYLCTVWESPLPSFCLGSLQESLVQGC